MIKDATYLSDLDRRQREKYSAPSLQMSVSTSTFRWTECYRVNIALLDQQHQQLIDTVNELDQALRTGEGKSVVDAVLDKLVEYALVYFTAEGRLMQQHDLPGLVPLIRRSMKCLREDRDVSRRSKSRQAGSAGFTAALHARVDERALLND
jgi:hemerythrin-like metal-binding protein